jgi:YD repeat-containing protein
MRFFSKSGLTVSVLCCALSAAPVAADTKVNPSTEYLNRIKVGESVQPLGDTPFGESVSLYTGTVSFRQTDISYPGIGPTINLTRSYEVSGSPVSFAGDFAMADWDLSIPRVSTLVPIERHGAPGTWKVSGELPDARCSRISQPAQTSSFGELWWHGYQLTTSDGAAQTILKRSPANGLAPNNDVLAYPLVTQSHWMIGCLPTTANGLPGEAFFAIDTDGTKYWFDQMAFGAEVEALVEQVASGGSAAASLAASSAGPSSDEPGVSSGTDALFMFRRKGFMYVTRVEDRFGNYLAYSYNAANQLIEINASDSRRVVISWRADAPLVDNITLQPGTPQARVWRYEYSAPTDRDHRALTRVVQPDQTAWSFGMAYASTVGLSSPNPDAFCGQRTFVQRATDDNFAVANIVHPSGLVGTFNFSVRAHARSQVPDSCTYSNGSAQPPREVIPPLYLSLSLTSKTFAGPGLAATTWRYLYSAASGSTQSECSAGGCQETSWVEVTDPTNQITHFTHSTNWGYMEGKLASIVPGVVVPGLANPSGLQVESSFYAAPTLGPYPAILGSGLEEDYGRSNKAPGETLSPENLHQILRQGVYFFRQTLGFDRFAQPEVVSRFSTLGYDRRDTTTYLPVGAKWVLGQAATVMDNTSGKLMNRTEYDANLLPSRTYQFGLLSASYSYYANGSLLQLTDPLNHATTLSQYYRGVPQRIEFADATVVAPTVDDFGQVTGVRNQLGDSTTYGYDVMGRITRVSYPTGDSVAWNDSLRGFTRVDLDEYGIPAGHWKQTVQTGNGRATNFYDALWRPLLILSQDLGNPASRTFVVKRYDGLGREIFSSYPVASLGSVSDPSPGVATTYDALGRVTTTAQDSELGPLITRTNFLPGFQIQTINPRSYSTTTSFQAFDTPSTDSPVLIQEPEGTVTTITRDWFGKPLQIKRSGG